MAFQLIPVDRRLHVEGRCEAGAVGDFAGPVLAVGVRDTDPVASVTAEQPAGDQNAEGLAGWGSTYFLVADADKPAPVWVAKGDVSSHWLEDDGG